MQKKKSYARFAGRRRCIRCRYLSSRRYRRIRDLGRRRATATRNRDSFTPGRDDVLDLTRDFDPSFCAGERLGKIRLIDRETRATSTILRPFNRAFTRGEILNNFFKLNNYSAIAVQFAHKYYLY